MISLPLVLCLFQHPVAITANSHQSTTIPTHLNIGTSVNDLASLLRQEWNTVGSQLNEIDVLSIVEGTFVGRDIEIAHRSLELSGKLSSERNEPATQIIGWSELRQKIWEDIENIHTMEGCVFSVKNASMWLKWMDFSLIDNSSEGRQKKNEGGSPRLAVDSDSILMISESRIELSPWTSLILISPSTFEKSGTESPVVVQKCLLWNDVGKICGVVETSSFPDCGGSVSVSIVGCSFDSQRLLGRDGIGLSLTRKARKRNEEMGTISSSVIGCSFVNMSSIGSSCQPQLSHLNQKMLGCVVSLSSSHLSGSTIRDVNVGGSVFCSNSSFSSLLPSPNTDNDANPSPSIILDGETSLPFDETTPYTFDDSADLQIGLGADLKVYTQIRHS
ncbi:hypothetical protein BLNAU_12469 [Blattamonas nauphoetae]|uniref:Uncharacterized protein n=1 Tax=Blattamonas nauphoetae TaxID=2049346 RepID=A0ABQ9XJN6_9EUKA|nr:hypothetical protein BLNAU_12469 [Blattamonas nauphoetae]